MVNYQPLSAQYIPYEHPQTTPPPHQQVPLPQTPSSHGILTRIHDIIHCGIFVIILFIIVYAILVGSCVSDSGN